jgi:hypothetical protein
MSNLLCAPRGNPKNLWLEPHSQSKVSDPLETQLRRNVCKGVMKLTKARAGSQVVQLRDTAWVDSRWGVEGGA